MTGTGKLGKSYGKYGSNPDRIKSIRITEEQESNWNPDLIRSVLEGNHKSDDSIRINKLKSVLKTYHLLFEKNIKYIMESEKMKEFIMNHDEFNQITEVL